MCIKMHALYSDEITSVHHHAWSTQFRDYSCLLPRLVHTVLGLQMCTSMHGVHSAGITDVHLLAWSTQWLGFQMFSSMPVLYHAGITDVHHHSCFIKCWDET